MKFKAGFIGTGNMGGALAHAVSKTAESVTLFDINTKKAEALSLEIGAKTASDIKELVAVSNFVFLAVKPNVILKLAEEIKGYLKPETVVVTMAAGVSLEELTAVLGSYNCIRIMPNTPAAVGEGMILYCCAKNVTKETEKGFLELMSACGKTDLLDEKLFDAAAALSGCGPAFTYMFAQSLADGAVSCGVPRDKANAYAAQTLLGSAKMLLESGKHPEQLKDEVCSPGGTTIEGVLALEKGGFRSAGAKAVVAAYEKTSKLKK